MFEIKLPVGVEGDATKENFAAFCEHFSCQLQKRKRGDVYWTITTEDASNFFWLGSNINFYEKTNLGISVASKYLVEKDGISK
jgi:hypothetical protein